MPDNETATYHLSIAKRYILRENKIPDDEIDKIKSDAEADELIKYLRQNKAPEEEEEEEKEDRMNNVGDKDFKLPDPKNPGYKVNKNVEDFIKPARVNNFLDRGVFERGARLMRVFGDDNYPEGRVI